MSGLISMKFSAFAFDGRSDLSMVIYDPATQADALSALQQQLWPQRYRKMFVD